MTRWDVIAGFGLDLILGDPKWLPHPVRAIGRLIAVAERLARGSGIPLRWAGTILCGGVVTIVTAAVWICAPWANVYWIFSFLALRSLDKESAAVIDALRAGDIAHARAQVAMIVGRDTANLEEQAIVRAVIETVSENLSDGLIAPLFYLGLLGPAGMAAYKAVNTLDSMIGYKNERYHELGWASARLDDVLNFIPARLSAGLVWAAAVVMGMSARRAFITTVRDGGSQPSPNSGWPEAAFAGALGIRLGGMNFYGGTPSFKPYLGDGITSLTVSTFADARKLLYLSSFLMVALVVAWV